MSESDNEATRQEIEKLRLENSKLRDDWLELTDQMLSFTGLPGQMHRIDVKMKVLKSLLVRAGEWPTRDALTVSSGTPKGGRVIYGHCLSSMTRERYCGALLTFAPLTDMISGGPFHLKPDQWTDDTSMALCLAESLIEKHGFDAKDQMDRYACGTSKAI